MSGRGSLLRALEAFRAVNPTITLHQIIAWLHVAESEGVAVGEVALRASLTQSTASRSLRACGPPGAAWSSAPALDLLQPFLGPGDGRSHAMFLTPAGQRLRAQLDAIILAPRPLSIEPAADRRSC